MFSAGPANSGRSRPPPTASRPSRLPAAVTDGVYRAHAVQVLTCTGTGVSRIVSFIEPRLFATFGLPQELSAGRHHER